MVKIMMRNRAVPRLKENQRSPACLYLSICYFVHHASFAYRGFPGGSGGKESACNAGDSSSIPGWGQSPGEDKGNPLQYSCLENPMDRGAWQGYSLGLQSWTQLKRLSTHVCFLNYLQI